MAARTAQQPPDLTGLVAGLGAAGAVAATVFGYPGAPVLWVALIVAAFMARPPMFTGKKDRNGRPTPAHPGESKQMLAYRTWSEGRWRLMVPNADWLPGKDPLATWFAGLLAGVAVAGLPTFALPDMPFAPALNGAFATVLVWQVAATLRRNAAEHDPSPGLRLGALRQLPSIGKAWPALLVGAVVAAVVAATLVNAFLPAQGAGAFGANSGVLTSWAVGLIVSGAVLFVPWRKLSLTTWRELVAARTAWEPQWQVTGLKDDSPWLLTHEVLGPVTVDTFDAPASTGAAFFCTPAITGKVTVALGANQRVWIVSCPNLDGQGQPVPGSVHPTQFRVVHLPADQMPDLTDATLDLELVKVLLEGAMGAACDASGVSRYLLMSADLVTAHHDEQPAAADAAEPVVQDQELAEDIEEDQEDRTGEKPAASSPWAVWATTWVNPDGLAGTHLRSHAGPALAGQLGVPALVDHRFGNGQGLVLVGPAAHPDVVFEPATGLTNQQTVDIEREDVWRGHWESVLKQGVNAPVPQMPLYAEAQLPGSRYASTTVYQLPFVTLKGEPPETYFGLEPKLQAALNAAPFVAVTGYPGANANARPGDRHTQAVTVIWSDGPVPEGPQTLPPSSGRSRSEVQQWILAGRFNAAFKAARLAQPEVASATSLTSERSRGHIWRVDVRLYGGVTLADVRGAAARIRGALGCAWLRVAAAEDGCTIFAGERPERVTLQRPERDQKLLIALDWEQAWLDSKVSGVGGLLPKLVNAGALPRNPKVQELEFDLPAGLSMEDIKAAVSKLRTATSNVFIEVRPGGSASSVQLLVCEVNPLPDLVEFDFDYIDGADDVPFASGVEGEPISYDYMLDPHLLIVGGSGSGKSATLQGLLYSVIALGCDLYLADPTKGGADFRFALPWMKSFTADVFEASAMMNAIYDEVLRRKNLNSKHGVGSYIELPDDVRPRHAVVVLDEFTSLMIADQLPPKPEPEDEEGQAEYQLALALKAAKINIGAKAGRIAREARSAGVTLLLATQRLTAKTLDGIPGASDLRTNMARMILGKATFGEMQSALKEPTSAPTLGDVVPRGRGLLEISGAPIRMIQCWYTADIQRTLAAKLTERRRPLTDEERVDLTPFMPRTDTAPPSRRAAEPPEPVEVELGEVEIEWDESVFADTADESAQPGEQTDDEVDVPTLDADDDADDVEGFVGEDEVQDVVVLEADRLAPVFADELAGQPEPEPAAVGEAVLLLDVDETIAPLGASAWPDARVVPEAGMAVSCSPTLMARLGGLPVSIVWATDWQAAAAPTFDALLGRPSSGHLAERDSVYGWWKVEAVEAFLDANPQVRTVVFADDKLEEVDDLDITYRDILADILLTRGVRHLLLVPSGPELTEADLVAVEQMLGAEPEPEPVTVAPRKPGLAKVPPRELWTPPGSAKPKEYLEEF